MPNENWKNEQNKENKIVVERRKKVKKKKENKFKNTWKYMIIK